MKTFNAIVAFALAMLLSFGAHAAGAYTGTIAMALPMPDGEILYYFVGSPTIPGSPSCASYPMRFATDGTTVAGKQQSVMLYAAMLAGKTIAFYGTGTCGGYTSEWISYAVIVQ